MTGLIVEPERADALADAIELTIERPDLAAERAARARARFLDGFTVERVAERMSSFYERALSTS